MSATARVEPFNLGIHTACNPDLWRSASPRRQERFRYEPQELERKGGSGCRIVFAEIFHRPHGRLGDRPAVPTHHCFVHPQKPVIVTLPCTSGAPPMVGYIVPNSVPSVGAQSCRATDLFASCRKSLDLFLEFSHDPFVARRTLEDRELCRNRKNDDVCIVLTVRMVLD